MPILNHVAIVLSYVLLAAAIAVSLPHHAPVVEPRLAHELAVGVLLVAAVVHTALSRLARDRALAADINALHAAYVQMRTEFTNARDEMRRIEQTIAAAMRTREGPGADLGAVMAEVKMLHELVDQLSRHPAPARSAPVAAPTGSPTAAPRKASELSEGEVLDIVRDGLRANRVDLFVQPIVSLPQRKHRHLECFSRIRDADNLMITPEQYLGVAEREGLVGAIDNMLLFRSVQLVRRIQKRDNFGLFLNISEHTLADADFFREFVAFLAANRDLAPRLVFEFVQSHVAHYGKNVSRELDQLARLGFRFSMDQITDLNLDVDELGARNFRFVKVEAGLLLAQTRAEGQRLDMRAFKAALDRNGIDLIVERIETEAIVRELLDHPIDLGQGFLFGEPRLAKDV